VPEGNERPYSQPCVPGTHAEVLWKRPAAEILAAGEPLKSQVELLISIKGVTPLIALAFMADVADIRRFRI